MTTALLQAHIEKAIDATTGGPCCPMDKDFAAAVAKYVDLYDNMNDKDALQFIICILQHAQQTAAL